MKGTRLQRYETPPTRWNNALPRLRKSCTAGGLTRLACRHSHQLKIKPRYVTCTLNYIVTSLPLFYHRLLFNINTIFCVEDLKLTCGGYQENLESELMIFSLVDRIAQTLCLCRYLEVGSPVVAFIDGLRDKGQALSRLSDPELQVRHIPAALRKMEKASIEEHIWSAGQTLHDVWRSSPKCIDRKCPKSFSALTPHALDRSHHSCKA